MPSLVDEDDQDSNGWPSAFLDDFESRLWFTYRSDFSPIKRSANPNASSAMTLAVRLRIQLADKWSFTTDTGWGCMIRSGQCLMANAMTILQFGRDWRRGSRNDDERRLLSLFADDPRAPYSIHNFVDHGASACGTYPGQWFGPSATARCIKALSQKNPTPAFKVYVTGDGADVYEDTLFRIAQEPDNTFAPVLILVGTRLGIKGVTPVYWDALKASLQLPQSIGIAGGSPSSSHYFVGVQGDKFFYLDPHQARPALPLHEDVNNYSTEDMDSCHTRRLRRLHISGMDPSMLIAFLIRDAADWRNWREALSNAPGKPVVRVSDTEPLSHNNAVERQGAVDEVESFDEDDNEGDGEIISLPP